MRKSPMSSLQTGMKKKKRCGFIMLVVESAAAGCGIPSCDSLRKKLSKLHNANNAEIRLTISSCEGSSCRISLPSLWRFPSICVDIYTHPHISQSDFPVMRFVALKHMSTETKMMNYSFAGTWGQADKLTTRQGKRDDKKRIERAKKKRCGFI